MKILAISVGVFILAASLSGAVALDANKEADFPTGCWGKRHFNGRAVSGLWLCFHENGDLHGVDVTGGHGADFGGQWELTDMGKLRLKFQDISETCSVHWSVTRTALSLQTCTDPGLNGVFEPVPNQQ